MFSFFKQTMVRWGFSAGIFSFVLVTISAGLVVVQFTDYLKSVEHTHKVIELITRIDALIDRSETSQRGYILRPDPKLLKLYRETSQNLPAIIDELELLVSDNPLQEERVQTYDREVQFRIEKMNAVLSLAQTSQISSVLREIDIDANARLRELAKTIKDEELRLLAKRQAYSNRMSNLAAVLILFGAIAALTFMFLSRYNMRKAASLNFEQSALLTSIFDSMGDGLMVINEVGRVVKVNRAAETMLGMPLNNLPAEKRIRSTNVINPATGEPLKLQDSPLTRALGGESIDGFETIAQLKPGGDRTLSTNARTIRDREGKITGALALFRDVTDLKNLEREWAAARNSAIEASRLKSDFLANMSHEIRTPMNGVLGMATILLDTRLDSDQASYVKSIKSSADSLLILINQILDHSKIESGKLELTNDDFNLHECVEGVITMFRYLSRSRNISLVTELHPELPEFLRGDSTRLRQILINLVGNALKFTEQGVVTLTVEPSVCSTSMHQIMFIVNDTGPGIPQDAQSRLFNRFSQVQSEGALRTEGSGLGLMISRDLVKLMKGHIGFKSQMGAGSTFWFTAQFDLAQRVVHQPMNPNYERQMYSGKILVAEDQTINQAVIRKFLEKFGLNCEIVANGRLAVEAFKREKYDLVFMDCQMPEMDGYMATKAIRDYEKTVRTHAAIVALSAEGRSDERKRCLDAGMNEFLSKPVEIDRLENILAQFLKPQVISNAFKIATLEKLMQFDSDGTPLALILIEDFLKSTPVLVEEMRAAAAAKNFELVANHAHALRSTSLTLGLEALGQICGELEDDPQSGSQIALLKDAWGEACAWLKDFQGSRSSQVA